MPAPLLLRSEPAAADAVVAVVPSRWDRLVARWSAFRLDEALAAGVEPETAAPLMLRAQRLLSEHERAVLAASLRRVLERARASPPAIAQVPVSSPPVLRSASKLERLIVRLRSGPASVRGVAQARLLVVDGRSPLYGPADDDALDAALDRVTASLSL